jgi:hypothetical protein
MKKQTNIIITALMLCTAGLHAQNKYGSSRKFLLLDAREAKF